MADKDIIEFFDSWAEIWDERMIIDDEIVGIILDNAAVTEGKQVLDVACGTGVLIPYYLKRNVACITGIDISPKMAEIAADKFDQKNVRIICGNAMTYDYDQLYDCIVIYNAFPHFEEPERMIEKLSSILNKGGTLTVAHGMSREKINMHHNNVSNVSRPLPDTVKMAEMFAKHLRVLNAVSDERMYLVTGIKA